MTHAIVVRRAIEADLEAVATITVDAYRSAHQLDDGPDGGYGLILADAAGRSHDAVLLVATRHDQVLGTVTICPQGSPFREIGRDGEVEFRFLAVEPSAWGTGIGTALVDACVAHAQEVGADRLVISVRDNNREAQLMYERQGFIRMPKRDWQPVPGVELLAMHRPAGVGPTGLEPMTSSL